MESNINKMFMLILVGIGVELSTYLNQRIVLLKVVLLSGDIMIFVGIGVRMMMNMHRYMDIQHTKKRGGQLFMVWDSIEKNGLDICCVL